MPAASPNRLEDTGKDYGAVPQVAGVALIFIEPIRDLVPLSSLHLAISSDST
jgi:hypothetical protein